MALVLLWLLNYTEAITLNITKRIMGLDLPINHSCIMKNYLSMRAAQSERVLTTPGSSGKQKYVGISSRLLPMALFLGFPLMYYVTLYHINIKKKKI